VIIVEDQDFSCQKIVNQHKVRSFKSAESIIKINTVRISGLLVIVTEFIDFHVKECNTP
jgi:hypothetical protein